ncbi:colicin V synthesis protein [Serratia proteamaculans]|uniref:colicin V synthesis protein n=1 Tax=Serratia proteamaculans TaxID=28151 RepID=UPI00107605A7|nr:colicin V synthesis protein [Serratia proteamaculans]TFZ50983.1 colicin V synthesis protein [Serratia proteamaculans]
MRELAIYEVEQVSGGYGNGIFADLAEAVTSSVIGAIGAGWVGAYIGGTQGGTGGGWGFGALGQLVGMLGAGAIGMIGGAVGAPILGINTTLSIAMSAFSNYLNGTFKP